MNMLHPVAGTLLQEQHSCIINAQHHILQLYGKSVSLQEKNKPHHSSSLLEAFVQQDLYLPPLSEIEVIVATQTTGDGEMVDNGVYILRGDNTAR